MGILYLQVKLLLVACMADGIDLVLLASYRGQDFLGAL